MNAALWPATLGYYPTSSSTRGPAPSPAAGLLQTFVTGARPAARDPGRHAALRRAGDERLSRWQWDAGWTGRMPFLRGCCRCPTRATTTGATVGRVSPAPAPATTSSPTFSACSACTPRRSSATIATPTGRNRANWCAFAGESRIDRLIRGLSPPPRQRLAADSGLDPTRCRDCSSWRSSAARTRSPIRSSNGRRRTSRSGRRPPALTTPFHPTTSPSAELHRLAAASPMPTSRRRGCSARRRALPVPARCSTASCPRPAARLPRHDDPALDAADQSRWHARETELVDVGAQPHPSPVAAHGGHHSLRRPAGCRRASASSSTSSSTPASGRPEAAACARCVTGSALSSTCRPPASNACSPSTSISAAYRLDAWQTGFVTRRLDQQRFPQGEGGPEDRSTVMHLGAFGWLENVRPAAAARTVDPEEIPPDRCAATASRWSSSRATAGSSTARRSTTRWPPRCSATPT